MFNDHTIATPCLELPSEGHNMVLSSQFELFLDGKIYKNVQTYLYDKQIYLKLSVNSNTLHFRIAFDFDLIFQCLSLKIQDLKKWNINNCNSIKLQRKQKYIELRINQNSDNIANWRIELSKRLNQRGFHQLFKPIRELGKGNFGTVYLVNRNQDNTQCAIKAFSKQATFGEDKGRESLINQIEIMRRVNHKNLMKIFQVYESQNSIYVCVEYLKGQQLLDRIKSKHKFDAQQLKNIMRSILSGLESLHSLNIMHRDLKPENILFRNQKDTECVIADFGLSEQADNEELLFTRCGTPGYVAPEVVNLKTTKAKYGVACDMFSLGIIFHLLILKKSPFPGKIYDEVLEQNKTCKFNFQAFEYQQIPSSWMSLLKALLEKDPSKRITATQALNHQFFRKQPLISKDRYKGSGNTLCIEVLVGKAKKTSLQCDSPLMMTRNIARKNQGLLRDDSCLKFKMKENMVSNKIEDETKQNNNINSPLLFKQNVKMGESRFKKMAQRNS